MRVAFKRLLASPSALSLLRSIVYPRNHSVCQGCFHGASGQEHAKRGRGDGCPDKQGTERAGEDYTEISQCLAIESMANEEAASECAPNGAQQPQPIFAGRPQSGVDRTLTNGLLYSKITRWKPSWFSHLSTFEQYQEESNLEISHDDRPRLVNDERYNKDWKLWLELVRFRRRHHGTKATQTLYNEILRRDLSIPTKGSVGKELWDTSIMIAYQNPDFLREIAAYAIKLKRAKGEAWPRLYYSVVLCGLKMDPTLAFELHVQLKEDFAPSLTTYQKLFDRSTAMDNVDAFEALYRDFPLPGLYATVVPELCRLMDNRKALRWHYLLTTSKDFPSRFDDLKPLLAYLAHVGDDRQIEQIVKDLKDAQSDITPIPAAAERFVRERHAISREIFNRQLGEVHGVAPKHLSDGFCARLFATKLFSIDTTISGLQMMAVETVGPLSIREIASRLNYHPSNISRHLDRLNDAGISPDNSAFSLLVRKLAFNNEQDLLRSVVECDLHPDTFEDPDVQERLLAQFYEKNDPLLIERTLAAITIRCREQDLAKWRWNLVLRSHITLRKVDEVRSILETMKREGILVTSRSSRHLRVRWLTERRVGRAAHSTKELSIIINATLSTMQSGRHVPIIAWREILRRLGMAGRLSEFERLVYRLVDHYTSAEGIPPLPSHILITKSTPAQRTSNSNPQAFLRTLFTTAAQHAIITWGFQQAAKCPPASYRRVRSNFTVRKRQRPMWAWGLVLLRNLQKQGVPIHRSTILRICIHRLNNLFGHGISRRRINRRSRALDHHAFDFYVREITKIWGNDLFKNTRREELLAPRGRTASS